MDVVWLLIGMIFVLLILVCWLTLRVIRLEFRLVEEKLDRAFDRVLPDR